MRPIRFSTSSTLSVIGRTGLLACPLILLAGPPTYQKPPREILEAMNAPATPTARLSPAHDWMALGRPRSSPLIAELARPMLRIAGMRIDPGNNALRSGLETESLTLVKLDGTRTMEVKLPPNPRISWFEFSPDGTRFA